MKIHYKPKDDLLHIVLRETNDVRNERYNDDIVFDVDNEGRVVGIEILDATEYLEIENLLNVTVVQDKVA